MTRRHHCHKQLSHGPQNARQGMTVGNSDLNRMDGANNRLACFGVDCLQVGRTADDLAHVTTFALEENGQDAADAGGVKRALLMVEKRLQSLKAFGLVSHSLWVEEERK